jgi:hypothetical protein
VPRRSSAGRLAPGRLVSRTRPGGLGLRIGRGAARPVAWASGQSPGCAGSWLAAHDREKRGGRRERRWRPGGIGERRLLRVGGSARLNGPNVH